MNNLKSTRGTTPLREMVKRIDRRSVDIPLLSKLENGVCLPTVETMPAIERAYGLTRSDLYPLEELDFGVSATAQSGYKPRVCGSCKKCHNDVLYLSDPPLVKCQITGNFHLITDICDQDTGGIMVADKPTTRRRDYHRLKDKRTFRLPDSLSSVLTDEVLSVCGYSTAQDWFCACVRRLHAQHAAILSHRKEP